MSFSRNFKIMGLRCVCDKELTEYELSQFFDEDEGKGLCEECFTESMSTAYDDGWEEL